MTATRFDANPGSCPAPAALRTAAPGALRARVHDAAAAHPDLEESCA